MSKDSNNLVSVIVVNWNGKKWLKKCIDSILAQTYKHVEIVLVDNASTDDSVKYIKLHYPQVKLVINNENLGFAGGNNRGIAAATGEYVMLLNNDAWIPPKLINNLLAYLKDKKLDIVAPFEAKYELGTEKIVNSTIDPLGHPINTYHQTKKLFYSSGVCLLAKRNYYYKTLGLDNDFFMYSEEVDWFWRIHLLRGNIANVSDNFVYHSGAGSTGTGVKYNSFLWRNQNTLQMLLKNYKWYSLLWVLPIYALQNICEMLVFLMILKPKIASTYPLGWWFNIRHLRRTLQKRRYIQSVRKVGDWQILKLMYLGPAKLLHLIRYTKHMRLTRIVPKN